MRISTSVKHAALVAAFVSAMAVTSAGLAQSNSTGSVVGVASAGDVVIVKNPKTGFSRTITVGPKGKFRVGSLPIGSYVVTVQHADGRVVVERPVAVRIGLSTLVK